MPSALAVRGGATPVLLQEHPEPLLRGVQLVFRVQSPELGVATHSEVEPADQCHEGVVTTYRVVERLGLEWASQPLGRTASRPWQDETERTSSNRQRR